MPWTATTNPRVQAFNTDTVGGSSVRYEITHPSAETSYANGTGAGLINLAWTDTRTYSTGGTTLDLTTLAAATTNTGAATFTAIKAMKVTNNDAAITIVVGNAGATPFNPGLSAATTTFTVQPGGTLYLENPTAAGWSCSTNKNLLITASSGTPSVTVVLVGLD
jgi:hypothetical protein